LHEAPVKADLALRGAASPACLGVGQEHTRQRDVELGTEMLNALLEVGGGVTTVPPDHRVAHMLLVLWGRQRQFEDIAVAQLHDGRSGARDEPQLQLSPQEIEQLPRCPLSLRGLACSPDLELAQHPGFRILEQLRNISIRRTPGHAHREPAVIHGQNRAAAFGAALEDVFDILLTEPDCARFGQQIWRTEQI